MRLIDGWRVEVHRLWTVRAGIFFFVLNGAVIGLAALGEVLNPWLFLGLNMAGYGLIGTLRLLKQAPAVDVKPSLDEQETTQ